MPGIIPSQLLTNFPWTYPKPEKRNDLGLLQTVLAEVCPLTLTDAENQDVCSLEEWMAERI